MEKSTIITALRRDERPSAKYNELLQLFMKHPLHGPAQAKYYNSSGFSPANLETLKYDLKQCYGITDAEVRAFVPEEKKNLPTADNTMTQEKDFENLDYHTELKPLATQLAEKLGHALPDMKKATLLAYLQDQKAKATEVVAEVVSAYESATDQAKDGLKFRVEFPFLSEEDCPDKLKVLVSDKFTALEKFEAAHEEIQRMRAAGETEGLFELGKKAVENWELNQEIYDELHYYQEHKEILGNHPIFADEMLQKTVDGYKTKEVVKRQGNLRSYISREGKKLEGMEDAAQKQTVEAKLAEWQKELDLIDKRLNADTEKK